MYNNPIAQLLHRTAEFFQDHGWTTKALARDKYRTSVGLRSPAACAFCVSGALQRVQADEFPEMTHHDQYTAQYMLSNLVLGGTNLPYWNDRIATTKNDVIQALLTGAEKAEATPSKEANIYVSPTKD